MKAEMAVRSISASISAWAARTAPRTISSVTASQAVGAFFRVASGMAEYCRCSPAYATSRPGMPSVERCIGAVLHEHDGDEADDRGQDHEVGRRDRTAGQVDQ